MFILRPSAYCLWKHLLFDLVAYFDKIYDESNSCQGRTGIGVMGVLMVEIIGVYMVRMLIREI